MGSCMNEINDSGILVDEHLVSWPSAISDQALAMLKGFHATKIKGDTEYPALEDVAGWNEYIRGVNAAIMVNSPMYAIAEREGVSGVSTQINGIDVHIATPENLPPARQGKVVLEMHGGGLVFLRGEGARRGSLREASRLGVKTISVDFRVPPDHPYPCALDDCVAAYSGVLAQYGPKNVIVSGISGGGNLAAAMLLRARDEGLALPTACILLTPEVDLTETGDTFETLAGLDPVLRERLTTQISLYAGNSDLSHPYLSPLFGDFSKGFPPTFLQSGTRDMFLSNTVRIHRALRSAGIRADLHVWEGMPHGGFMQSPEDDEISHEMRQFISEYWD